MMREFDAVIIGGGPAGLTVAKDLAEAGKSVLLVERRPHLGGRLPELGKTFPLMVEGADLAAEMIAALPNLVTVELDTTFQGMRSRSSTTEVDIVGRNGKETVSGRTVVMATGLEAVDLNMLPEFGVGLSENVITTLQLERLMASIGPTHGRLLRPSDSTVPRTVVFAQCVGSRVERRGVRYCCSIGCLNAVKNSTLIMERNPGTQAYVCYIDMRMHGRGYEEAYKEARSKGVRFIRGQPSLVRQEKECLLVCGENTLLKELYEIPADLVVLCPGLEIPSEMRMKLSSAGVMLEDDGLVHIPNEVEGPCRTSNDMVFLAGSIESPQDLKSTIMHAHACSKAVLGSF